MNLKRLALIPKRRLVKKLLGFDEIFTIAFREKRGGTLLRESGNPFRPIAYSSRYWYADPITFCHEGKQYLFAEEYDRDTLRKEYMRDVAAGIDIQIPQHYFPNDDPAKMPRVNWRSCAHLLYGNWLNYCVYQTSPYDIRDIEKGVRTDD